MANKKTSELTTTASLVNDDLIRIARQTPSALDRAIAFSDLIVQLRTDVEATVNCPHDTSTEVITLGVLSFKTGLYHYSFVRGLRHRAGLLLVVVGNSYGEVAELGYVTSPNVDDCGLTFNTVYADFNVSVMANLDDSDSNAGSFIFKKISYF